MSRRGAGLRQPETAPAWAARIARAARVAGLAWALLPAAPNLFAMPASGAIGESPDWVLPQDPGAAAERSDEYAWRLFVAINWPLDPATGRADPVHRIGQGDAVAWEGWANARAVFRRDGRDPGVWPAAGHSESVRAAERFDGSPSEPATPVRHIVDGRMVTLAPLPAAPLRLIETRIDEVSFDYIRQRRLYDIAAQLAALQRGPAVAFPAGSRHVKAEWQPIAAHARSRYFCKQVVLPDGRRQWYGLTALHIATKDLPNWFWATFEQVDNAGGPGHPAWPLKSVDRHACAGRAPDCDAIPRGIGLEGTVWRFYRLRGTMTDFVDAAGSPALLANSRLESTLRPGTSSCITCHARATVGFAQGHVTRLPIFDTAADGPAQPGRDPERARSGYIGRPQPQWYLLSGGGEPVRYEALDSVWFLERAHGTAMSNPLDQALADRPQRQDRP